MPIDITISNITGTTPFDVYICDTGNTPCIYVSTINSGDLPYTFNVPLIFQNLPGYNVRVIDDIDCIINYELIV